MAVISEKWPFLLEPGLREIFNQTTQPLVQDSRIPMLYSVKQSNSAYEKFAARGGMGDWTEYEGRIEYDEPQPGFEVTFQHTEYTKGIQIERSLVDDDQYGVIGDMVRQLALTAVRTREKHGASLFNNAFSTSYLGGDGAALVADSHALSPTNALTGDNKGTTALGYDAIIATAAAMRAFTDDRGEAIPITPDTILIPPGLEEAAFYATQSLNGPATPALGVPSFVRQQGYRIIVWNMLTDSNNWFMIDSQLARLHLHWFDRVPLEFAVDPTGSYHLMARYRGYMRYSFGWSDWRWIYGHEVAGG
jgi:hypothetical protein